jgi:hypothetical protein
MSVYNKQLSINIHGTKIKKNSFHTIQRKLLQSKIHLYSRGSVWKCIGLGTSNIIQFKSGDKDKFTNGLQGILKCFF